jgi:hypothetical protein
MKLAPLLMSVIDFLSALFMSPYTHIRMHLKPLIGVENFYSQRLVHSLDAHKHYHELSQLTANSLFADFDECSYAFLLLPISSFECIKSFTAALSLASYGNGCSEWKFE